MIYNFITLNQQLAQISLKHSISQHYNINGLKRRRCGPNPGYFIQILTIVSLCMLSDLIGSVSAQSCQYSSQILEPTLSLGQNRFDCQEEVISLQNAETDTLVTLTKGNCDNAAEPSNIATESFYEFPYTDPVTVLWEEDASCPCFYCINDPSSDGTCTYWRAYFTDGDFFVSKVRIRPILNNEGGAENIQVKIGDQICGRVPSPLTYGTWVTVSCVVPQAIWGNSIHLSKADSSNFMIADIQVIGRKDNADCAQDLLISDVIDTSSSTCQVDDFQVAQYEGCFNEVDSIVHTDNNQYLAHSMNTDPDNNFYDKRSMYVLTASQKSQAGCETLAPEDLWNNLDCRYWEQKYYKFDSSIMAALKKLDGNSQEFCDTSHSTIFEFPGLIKLNSIRTRRLTYGTLTDVNHISNAILSYLDENYVWQFYDNGNSQTLVTTGSDQQLNYLPITPFKTRGIRLDYVIGVGPQPDGTQGCDYQFTLWLQYKTLNPRTTLKFAMMDTTVTRWYPNNDDPTTYYYKDSYVFSDTSSPNWYPALGLMNTRAGGWRSHSSYWSLNSNSECDEFYTYTLSFSQKSLVHGIILAKIKPINKLRSTNAMIHNRAFEDLGITANFFTYKMPGIWMDHAWWNTGVWLEQWLDVANKDACDSKCRGSTYINWSINNLMCFYDSSGHGCYLGHEIDLIKTSLPSDWAVYLHQNVTSKTSTILGVQNGLQIDNNCYPDLPTIHDPNICFYFTNDGGSGTRAKDVYLSHTIQLGTLYEIQGIVFKTLYAYERDYGNYVDHVKKFQLEFSQDGGSTWQWYEDPNNPGTTMKFSTGLTDYQTTESYVELPNKIVATSLRIGTFNNQEHCKYECAFKFDVILENYFEQGYIQKFRISVNNKDYGNDDYYWLQNPQTGTEYFETGLQPQDLYNKTVAIDFPEPFEAMAIRLYITPTPMNATSASGVSYGTQYPCQVSGRWDFKISEINYTFQLPYRLSTSITKNTDCINLAKKLGLSYAGIHDGTNCFGGDSYPAQYNVASGNEGTCTDVTRNGDTEPAGGSQAVSVYQVPGVQQFKYMGCYQGCNSCTASEGNGNDAYFQTLGYPSRSVNACQKEAILKNFMFVLASKNECFFTNSIVDFNVQQYSSNCLYLQCTHSLSENGACKIVNDQSYSVYKRDNWFQLDGCMKEITGSSHVFDDGFSVDHANFDVTKFSADKNFCTGRGLENGFQGNFGKYNSKKCKLQVIPSSIIDRTFFVAGTCSNDQVCASGEACGGDYSREPVIKLSNQFYVNSNSTGTYLRTITPTTEAGSHFYILFSRSGDQSQGWSSKISYSVQDLHGSVYLNNYATPPITVTQSIGHLTLSQEIQILSSSDIQALYSFQPSSIQSTTQFIIINPSYGDLSTQFIYIDSRQNLVINTGHYSPDKAYPKYWLLPKYSYFKSNMGQGSEIQINTEITCDKSAIDAKYQLGYILESQQSTKCTTIPPTLLTKSTTETFSSADYSIETFKCSDTDNKNQEFKFKNYENWMKDQTCNIVDNSNELPGTFASREECQDACWNRADKTKTDNCCIYFQQEGDLHYQKCRFHEQSSFTNTALSIDAFMLVHNRWQTGTICQVTSLDDKIELLQTAGSKEECERACYDFVKDLRPNTCCQFKRNACHIKFNSQMTVWNSGVDSGSVLWMNQYNPRIFGSQLCLSEYYTSEFMDEFFLKVSKNEEVSEFPIFFALALLHF